MPRSFLNQLDFKINKEVKFQDAKTQLVDAVYERNAFTRDDILHTMNLFAQQFNNEKIHLGCAIHFKGIKRWCPAIMTPTNSEMKLFHPDEYSDTFTVACANDTIDGVHFFVVNYDGVNKNNAFYQPRISH